MEKEITINGIVYIPKDSIPIMAIDKKLGKYVIVRTYSAGVHAGYLQKQEGKEVSLVKSRRIWQWFGAKTLSELAMNGSSEQDKCKFGCPVTIKLTEAIEIIDCTEKARKSIEEVALWR